MNRRSLVVAPLLFALASVGCSDPEPRTGTGASTDAASATPLPAASTAPIPAATLAPVATLAPTGSAQACDGLITLVDDDGDGWGECVVTIETAKQQFIVIYGKYYDLRRPAQDEKDCDAYVAAIQTFNADALAAQWPAEVQPQIAELVAAHEYDLFMMDESCRYSSEAGKDAASLRFLAAVFEAFKAFGLPTDV